VIFGLNTCVFFLQRTCSAFVLILGVSVLPWAILISVMVGLLKYIDFKITLKKKKHIKLSVAYYIVV
jgi:hypothetical protein